MSPIRVNNPPSRGKPRKQYGVRPVSLPTFSFYGHLPVVYCDGELLIGRRVIPLERRS